MKDTQGIDPHDLNREEMKVLYQKIMQNFTELNILNRQYKHKQEDHFVRAFARILDKMSKELIFAKESFKNIDAEVRKDAYCDSLKAQLNTFKTHALQLRQLVKTQEKQLKQTNSRNFTLSMQNKEIKIINENKVLECLKLREEVKTLKHKIKALTLDGEIKYFEIEEEGREGKDTKRALSLVAPLNINYNMEKSSRQQKYRAKDYSTVRTTDQFYPSKFQAPNKNIKNSLTIVPHQKLAQYTKKDVKNLSLQKKNERISSSFQDRALKVQNQAYKASHKNHNTFRNKFIHSITKAIQSNNNNNPQIHPQLT